MEVQLEELGDLKQCLGLVKMLAMPCCTINILQSLKEGFLQLYKKYDAVQFQLKMRPTENAQKSSLTVWFGLILQP